MDLPDPLEALPPEEVACHNDMLSVGMQPGEAEALPIRMISTIVTASILSAWCDRSKMQRKLLFFAHWSRCILGYVFCSYSYCSLTG